MNVQTHDCPSDGELRAHLDGETLPQRYAALDAHLEACGDCRARLVALQADASLASRALQLAAPAQTDTARAWRRFRAEAAASPRGSRERSLIHVSSQSLQRFRRPLAAVAAVLVLVAFVVVAPLRTAAAQFLDVFRVKQIQVVTFDPEQVADPRAKLFERIVTEESEERAIADAEEAAQVVGMPVLAPASLPEGYVLTKFSVREPSSARAWIDIEAVRSLLDAAGLPTDFLPEDPDARIINARIPAVVAQRYRSGDASFAVLQFASPEVSVPRGMDAERIGEMGLRLLGYPAEQAAALATSINWATTLVLPVPLGAASAREVTVQGVTGFVLEDYESEEYTETSVVWQKDGVVYAVTGTAPADVLIAVAQSLR